MLYFNSMKILKIILIAIFLFSAIPFGGFCDDSDSGDIVDHCSLACQSICCFDPTLPGKISFNIPLLSSFLFSSEENFPQDVVVLVPLRPPIALS